MKVSFSGSSSSKFRYLNWHWSSLKPESDLGIVAALQSSHHTVFSSKHFLRAFLKARAHLRIRLD